MEKSSLQTVIFWLLFAMGMLVLAAALVLPTAAPPTTQWAQQAFTYFVNTLPFLVFGSLTAGFLRHYLTPQTVTAHTPKSLPASLLTASLLGLALPFGPVGIIPVASVLHNKGFPTHLTITLLLAAPAVNPITFLALTTTFGISTAITITILSLIIALTISIIAYQYPQQFAFISPTTSDSDPDSPSTLWHAITTAADTLLAFLPYFVLGCLLAAVWDLLTPILVPTLLAPTITNLLNALFSAHHPLMGEFTSPEPAAFITLSTMFGLTTITTLWHIMKPRTISILAINLVCLTLFAHFVL